MLYNGKQSIHVGRLDLIMAANEQRPASLIASFSWQRLARSAWYAGAVIALGIFILAIPALRIAAEEHFSGAAVGTEPSLLRYAITIASFLAFTAAALISCILAAVLFLKRPEDGMALFIAYFLLVYGVVWAGPLASFEYLWPGARSFVRSVLQPVILAPLLIAFLSIFPDGRFVPSWTRWLVVLSVLSAPVNLLLRHEYASSELPTLSIVRALFWFALIFGGLYGQVYRYRAVSSPTERQQTKWVVYGLALSILLISLLTFTALRYELPPGSARAWTDALGGLAWSLAIVALPITLSFAMLRYRLWDIDIIINRTLVYGSLTMLVVGIYVLVVGALGTFFQAQGNLPIALLATGIVAVLFQPLREKLQRGVNRLIYGEGHDPIEALSRLGRQLEMAVPTSDILPMLVETIAQTLKLPYVAIQLRAENEDNVTAEYGSAPRQLADFPFVYQGEHIGRLVVAQRSPASSFSPVEMRLLRNIARQAGAAAHAVELMADLQRSRQQLVAAREEERLRLRRDLHDGLGPALASVVWQADSARDLMYRDPSGAEQLLENSIEQAQSALADIRRLVYGLRPPALDELGLVGALEQAAQQHQQTAVTIEAPALLASLPAAVEVAAYRIVQEALKNAVEHGRADNCVVGLALDGNLCLTIADDGLGLPEVVTPGVGLVSMRERAEELGGTFKIRPRAEGGTKVEVSLPLELGG